MKKIFPILLILAGIAGGGAAGMMLKPGPDGGGMAGDAAEGAGDGGAMGDAGDGDAFSGEVGETARDYVEIGRQMIIPVVEGDRTRALMMFELAVDVPLEMRETVFLHEPRLRDAFLRELFAMSHTGAFLETYTDDMIVEELRRKLLAAAQKLLGPDVADVLILDIMRQEL